MEIITKIIDDRKIFEVDVDNMTVEEIQQILLEKYKEVNENKQK